MAIADKWVYYLFDEVGSTNDVIKDYCGESGKYVAVVAESQTLGRGRLGRNWKSPKGNLFFSLAFEYELQRAGELAFAASLSLLQAVKKIAPFADIRLKWPNDVLLNNAKMSGILLEKGPEKYMIIGIGVNVAASPEIDNAVYKITSLDDAGIKITALKILRLFMESFSQNLSLLQTNGFAVLREKWLENAKNLGKEITVRQSGKEEKGIFAGIDENAALLLKTPAGTKRILAGDVFFEEMNKKDE